MYLAELTEKPIDLSRVLAMAKSMPSSSQIGARVIFSGEIRGFSHGKDVSQLEYTAHKPLAEKHMLEVVRAAAAEYPLIAALCVHRLGMLEVGESAVVVITCGRHRTETYAANQYIINRVKAETPIWKREFFTDGTSMWGENCHH
ncbi:molybdenum cofactor biosynthesis protein MoaE [Turneriella parva]|uniref:Molybdopterin synthase catalytic subunit n=1 Tax=Turneriella parva (strain ATCC BAA-1111 / DSM 21527 / NCTC 11395 / H) TaxID=869212 RepID=I4B771_TURPD|nr:molybdenum cofactor biosynthesis protein MoaE [Turneriella parva]AFM13128.1 molybdopterin synthase subunit MoaE [Turneriella parva DSM 21527]